MKKKPTILVFIDWYLPGFKAGGPIQSCANLVEHLKEHANFYIITRNTDYCSTEPYATVIANEWNEVNGARVYYSASGQLSFLNLKRLVQSVQPDIIYINGVFSLYFSVLPLLIARQLRMKNVVVAARGMFAQSAVQVKGIKKKLFFAGARAVNLYNGVTFHATNKEEEKDIIALLRKTYIIQVAPNLPKKYTTSANAVTPKEKGCLRQVSVARIAPEKNMKFALEVLAGYKGAGTVEFDLYGPIYDTSYWQECEAVIRTMPDNVTVRYKGSIEQKLVSTTLRKYHALFMPTKGENFGHIILESLATGCPVLISDQTPWKNLESLGVGYDLPLTNKENFRGAIETLVNLDQEAYNCLSDKSFCLAMSYCNNESNVEANKALFNL